MPPSFLPTEQAAARRFADEWIQAWNNHDLESILAQHAEDVTVTSPVVARVLGNTDGVMEGKAALREYYARGLETYPDLHFELLDVLCGIDTLVLYYRNHLGFKVAEVVQLGVDGRIRRSWANYSLG